MVLSAVLGACGAAPHVVEPPSGIASARPAPIGVSVRDDPQVAAVVARYREQLGAKLSTILVRSTADIGPQGEPSNPLGLLVADAMLAHLRAQDGLKVDCFITNDGGLRAPLYAGDVRLSSVYEVMPFDNELVVVSMTGGQLMEVAHLIAKKNGEPLSGLRLVIDAIAGAASDVQVGSLPIDSDALYAVGTTDYLAESGWMSAIAEKLPTSRTGILMRDAIAQHFREVHARGETLSPIMDDRIRTQAPAPQGAP